jgi:hypothetical protein
MRVASSDRQAGPDLTLSPEACATLAPIGPSGSLRGAARGQLTGHRAAPDRQYHGAPSCNGGQPAATDRAADHKAPASDAGPRPDGSGELMLANIALLSGVP